MIVEELTPQVVVHDSGGIVASTGRHSFVYAHGGRALTLQVEPLDVYYLRIPDDPRWDDGTRLTDDELHQLMADVAATFAHWKERCEFVQPGDPRILHTLGELADYIRSEAIGTEAAP